MVQCAEHLSNPEPDTHSLGLLVGMTQWEVIPGPLELGWPSVVSQTQRREPGSRAMRRQAAHPATIVHILLPSTVTPRRRPEPQREDGVDQEEEDGAVSESLTTDCRRDLLYE